MNDPRIADILAARSRPWVAKAASLIEARVLDARQHAWHALTARVIAMADGRPTMRLAKRGASTRAAMARLDELADHLVGAGNEMRGVLLDARAAFYRDSFVLWEDEFSRDPMAAIYDPMAQPTKAGARNARGLMVHGRDVRKDVRLAIEGAKSRLLTAVTTAGMRGASDRQSADVLDTWASATTRSLTSLATAAISNADVAIYWAVGSQMVREEFRDDGD